MNHQQMRSILLPAFRRVIGRDATLPEIQSLQGVASLESAYGTGWKPPGDKSKNLGAIQAGSSWKGKTYQYTDTTPQADGSSKPYVTRFRFYDTWEEAADDLVRAVYVILDRGRFVLAPAGNGDTYAFSAGLHKTRYYEGFGKTVEARIANHHRSIVASIRAQALALNEDLPLDIQALPHQRELLRLGSSGAPVAALQEQLNRQSVTPTLKVDAQFGPATLKNVVSFQRRSGLVADGLVGDRTWDALVADTAPGTDPAPAA